VWDLRWVQYNIRKDKQCRADLIKSAWPGLYEAQGNPAKDGDAGIDGGKCFNKKLCDLVVASKHAVRVSYAGKQRVKCQGELCYTPSHARSSNLMVTETDGGVVDVYRCNWDVRPMDPLLLSSGEIYQQTGRNISPRDVTRRPWLYGGVAHRVRTLHISASWSTAVVGSYRYESVPNSTIFFEIAPVRLAGVMLRILVALSLVHLAEIAWILSGESEQETVSWRFHLLGYLSLAGDTIVAFAVLPPYMVMSDILGLASMAVRLDVFDVIVRQSARVALRHKESVSRT
jgi:hypothetical protein